MGFHFCLPARTWRNWQTHQIQVGQGHPSDSRDIEKRSPIVNPSRPEKGGSETTLGQCWGNPNPVELALAKAIEGATAAGRFDVVAQLAAQLDARRLAAAGVARLEDKRAKR